MAKHNDLGKEGELLAINYLLKNEYEILEKNYRFLKAEVDIIARNMNTVIGVEVKTRSSDFFGNPQDFITDKKIKLLVLAMNNYVIENDLDVEIRFDIIAILKQKSVFKIEHFKDAFLHF